MKIAISRRAARSAFTLTELAVSLSLTALMIGGLVSGFLQSAHQAEWSAYSLAAQAQAQRGLEQVRAAKWDPHSYPPTDQIITNNFPVRIDILDIPTSGTNITYTTNRFTITTISENPPLKLVRVDCTWRFMNRGLFTNSAFTYRAPDQ